MVGGFDKVKVVLDHHNGVAALDQHLEHVHQPVNVGDMQAGGRLVKNIYRLAGAAL